MNPLILLSALRARYRVLLLILLATVLTTTVVSLLIPKTYIATAALLVDSRDDQSVREAGNTPAARERTGYMQTQIDLITSQKVASRVINDLDLASSPATRAQFAKESTGEGSLETWLIDSLIKQLKVETSQSSVIQISFASADAETSARIANAFAKAYIDTTLELRVEPSRANAVWFDEQLKGLRENLEKTTDAVRLATAAGSAGSVALRVSPDDVSTPYVQNLKTELLRGETRLEELSTRLGVNHPQYQRQLTETQTMRQVLGTELNRAAGSASRQNVQSAAAGAGNSRNAASQLNQYQNQVGLLVRDAEIAQRAYEVAMQRALVTQVESRATRSNVSILYAAATPFKPARPRIVLNIALAFVLGGLLGLTAIYLLELFDRRVRASVDLQGDGKVPLLAELSPWRPSDLILGQQRLGRAVSNLN